MKIIFQCSSNYDYVAINTAKFKLKSGSTLTIDRKYTEWEKGNDGCFAMAWSGCYLWAIDDCYTSDMFLGDGEITFANDEYAVKSFKELTEGATVEFEPDCEVDGDYMVEAESFEIMEE